MVMDWLPKVPRDAPHDRSCMMCGRVEHETQADCDARCNAEGRLSLMQQSARAEAESRAAGTWYQKRGRKPKVRLSIHPN